MSEPHLARDGDYLHAIAEMVVTGDKPKTVDPAALTFTLLSSKSAISFEGCERH